MKNLLLFSTFLIMSCLIVSCEKEPTLELEEQAVKNKFLNYTLNEIAELGFDTNGVVEFEDYFLVEEDIMLGKDYFINRQNEPKLDFSHLSYRQS